MIKQGTREEDMKRQNKITVSEYWHNVKTRGIRCGGKGGMRGMEAPSGPDFVLTYRSRPCH